MFITFPNSEERVDKALTRELRRKLLASVYFLMGFKVFENVVKIIQCFMSSQLKLKVK